MKQYSFLSEMALASNIVRCKKKDTRRSVIHISLKDNNNQHVQDKQTNERTKIIKTNDIGARNLPNNS